MNVISRVSDYTDGIEEISCAGHRRMVLYIGSSIGNFEPCEAVKVLREVRRTLAPGDKLLLGADRVKERSVLIRAYDEGLKRHERHAAQLLLTHEDFDSRPRYLNMRNTLNALFECDAVPIINENDTISVDEIKFGDNDRLAAMVTNLIQAPASEFVTRFINAQRTSHADKVTM